MIELLIPKFDIFASFCLHFTHCKDSSPYHILGHFRPFKELISLNKFNHLLPSHKMCHCCPKSRFFVKTIILLLFFDICLIICFSKNFYAWHTNLYSETVLFNKCVLNHWYHFHVDICLIVLIACVLRFHCFDDIADSFNVDPKLNFVSISDKIQTLRNHSL